MDYIKLLLMLISGIAWTIVYIACIRIGFRHKTYAMPFWALSLNLAWEVLHGFYDLYQLGPQLQVIINAVWAVFDVFILYTFFKYGKRYFPKNLNSFWFYTWAVSGIVLSFFIQVAFISEFGTIMGGGYAAFLQNLLMSALFISMLIQRNGTEGQSLTIAISKCIGTLAPTILFGIIGSVTMGGPNKLMFITGCVIFVLDIAYIVLFRKVRIREMKSIKLEFLI
jgi:hypothetical protein